MVRAILVVLLLGIGYSNGMIAGMNPAMGNMMMAGALTGGEHTDMMQMMSLMNMMNQNARGAQGAADTTADPLLNGMMKMGLCRSTETNESPFCTQALCQMKGLRYGSPNMYECVPGFGCCYKDHQSLMVSNMLN